MVMIVRKSERIFTMFCLRKMIFTTLIFGGVIMETITVKRGDIAVSYYGQTVDDLIINYMERNNIPGLSLAIVQAPYIPRVVCYGLSDKQTKRLAATNTVFNIGQMTNGFTGIAIMQLVEEEKIKLDDPITRYLEDIPKKWDMISIRDLITHTSGLPSYIDTRDFDYSKEYTLSDIITLIKDQELLFEPGTNANPSATDHYLLGAIIEKASGVSYEDYITKNQIERIGLKNTFFISNQDTIKNEVNNGTKPFQQSQFLHNPIFANPIELATGYTDNDGELAPSKKIGWSATFAHSGMIASSHDISQWDICLAGDILIKDKKNRDFLYNPITLKNGQVAPGNTGWFFPGHKGLMEIKGNIPGYSSILTRFTDPSESLCVTLLVNKDNILDLDILARKIGAAFESKLAAARGASWSVIMQSPYAVQKTIDRVAETIKAHGGTVFARIDHAQEASKVNQKLLPTQVLVIGNPTQGTAMMQANPEMALDLPLRIMATQDSSDQVWLSFTDPVALAKEYGIKDPKQIQHLKKIYHALCNACQKAISPYPDISVKGCTKNL